MTAAQKRLAVRGKYKTLLGRNYYSQAKRDYCFKKYRNGKYYSDCSSSISYSYKEAGFSFGILNTVGMYNSTKMTDVPVVIKNGIIQNPEVLRIGDMLLFAGNDEGRKASGYVGHVEMVYDIDGSTVTLAGHGSGRPSTKNMNTYCKSRQATKSDTKLGHRGLIRVRRFIQDDVTPPDEDKDVKQLVITGNSVNIRVGNSTDFESVGTVDKGETFEYVATAENGWNAIVVGKRVLWVSGKYSKVK